MSDEKKPGRVAEFEAEYVRNISEAVYRDGLGADDVAKMIAKDKDSGEKLRQRAGSYDRLTRSYLRALGKLSGEAP